MVWPLASDAEIGDVDDVRMAQQSDGLRLSPEPLDEFAVTGQLQRNDFDGDATARARVSRAIDRPIPPRPQSSSISYFPSSNWPNHSSVPTEPFLRKPGAHL